MDGPSIDPGRVEQGLYTWSSHNLIRPKGEAFGKVSPGLRNHIRWLEKACAARFALNERLADGGEVKPYQGWRGFVATGVLRAGAVNIVYRKMANGGRDGVGRDRYVVHALVGRSDEFDLAAIGDQGAPWLEAEECPLDALPSLASLDVAELSPWRPAIARATLDDSARPLLEQLVASPGGLRVDQEPADPPADLVARLLVALPTALWPCVELDWFVGAEGPVARIRVRRDVSPHRAAPHRADAVDGALHRLVEDVWAELPRSDRTWDGFAMGFTRIERQLAARGQAAEQVAGEQAKRRAADERSAKQKAAKQNAASEKAARAKPATREPGSALPARLTPPQRPTRPPPDCALRGRAASELAAIASGLTWPPPRSLVDGEVHLAASRLEQLDGSPQAWMGLLGNADPLRALLKNAEKPSTVIAATRFLDTIGVATADLVAMWHETGLAVVGVALLLRDPAERTGDRWALPKLVDQRQLHTLVKHMLRSARGRERVGALWSGGFAARFFADVTRELLG